MGFRQSEHDTNKISTQQQKSSDIGAYFCSFPKRRYDSKVSTIYLDVLTRKENLGSSNPQRRFHASLISSSHLHHVRQNHRHFPGFLCPLPFPPISLSGLYFHPGKCKRQRTFSSPAPPAGLLHLPLHPPPASLRNYQSAAEPPSGTDSIACGDRALL